MNKLLLLATVALAFPCMTQASDKDGSSKSHSVNNAHVKSPRDVATGQFQSSRDKSRQVSPGTFALHNIGTGDGVTTRKGATTANRVNIMGDTGTHEVGHYRKRIDKSTPLLKKPGRQGTAFRKMGK